MSRARTITATRLIPVESQFVSIVPRGASRKTWKTLKQEDPMGSLVSLLARKAALELQISAAKRGATPFDVELASHGLTRDMVHTLVFNGTRFVPGDAQAWAKQREFTVAKVEETEGATQLTVSTKAEGDFTTVDLAPGVTAVVFKVDPDVAAKQESVLGVLDTAIGALLPSIAAGDAGAVLATIQKAETDIAAQLGVGGMMTTAELATKVEAQSKLLARLARKAGCPMMDDPEDATDGGADESAEGGANKTTPANAKKNAAGTQGAETPTGGPDGSDLDGQGANSRQTSPDKPSPAGAGVAPVKPGLDDENLDGNGANSRQTAQKAEALEQTRKAELATLIGDAVKAAVAPIETSLKSTLDTALGRIDRVEKSIVPPRRGTSTFERPVSQVEAPAPTKKTGGDIFDSALPWGRHART